MHLRWVFTVETAVVLLKNIFEFTLIRLEGFTNKISPTLLECSTWPSGKALAPCVEEPEFDSAQNLFLFASFFLFNFFLLVGILGITVFVMFLYIAYNF